MADLQKFIDGFFALGSKTKTDQFKRDLLERLVGVEEQTLTEIHKSQARENIGVDGNNTFIKLTDCQVANYPEWVGGMVWHAGDEQVGFSTLFGQSPDSTGLWARGQNVINAYYQEILGDNTVGLASGDTCRLQLTITGLTVGSLEIYVESLLVGTVTANGVYTFYFYAPSTGYLQLSATAIGGCDGTVVYNWMHVMGDGYQLGMKLVDESFVLQSVLNWDKNNVVFGKVNPNFFGERNIYLGDQSAQEPFESDKLRIGDIITGDLLTGNVVIKNNLDAQSYSLDDEPILLSSLLNSTVQATAVGYVAKITEAAGIKSVVWAAETPPDLSNYLYKPGLLGGQTAIGGTGITDVLSLQGTSGNGTATSPAINFKVGNNGGTIAGTVLNNGNVGIGTTSPGELLQVKGNIKILTEAVGTGKGFLLGRTATEGTWAVAAGANQYATGAAAGDVIIRTEAISQALILNSGAGAATLVVKNGNVGIGTTIPITSLDIKLATDQHVNFFITSGMGSIGSVNDAGSAYTPLGFYAERYYFGLGNVGIGTTAPTSKLHIKAGSTAIAPLAFTSGALTTGVNIRAGQIEFLTDAFYATITTGTARKTFAFLESPIFTGSISTPQLKILEGGSTPAKYSIFQGGDQAIDLTYTLPTAYPTVTGQALVCTDAGVMSWGTISQMVYPSAGIAVSTGSAWGTSIADNSANWNAIKSLGKEDYEIVTQAEYDALETYEDKFYFIEEV